MMHHAIAKERVCVNMYNFLGKFTVAAQEMAIGCRYGVSGIGAPIFSIKVKLLNDHSGYRHKSRKPQHYQIRR